MLPRDTKAQHAFRVLCLIFLILSASAHEVVEEGYSLLVDAGSTGSRAFVFHFTEVWSSSPESERPASIAVLSDGVYDSKNKQRVLLSRKVISLPGMKIKKGISSFGAATHWDGIVRHMLPIFVNASLTIPQDKWASTSVYMKGTAGMRLLPAKKQELIWSHVMRLNGEEGNPFTILRENLGTIDGSAEAYYAVLASNYIAKAIDGRLHRIEGAQMVGALDMGGSSTQLIFYKSDKMPVSVTGGVAVSDKTNKNFEQAQESRMKDGPVTAGDFWSHSWLSFGVEVVRERFQQTLIAAHLASAAHVEESAQNRRNNKSGFISVLNPCTQKGFWTDWTGFVSLLDSADDVRHHKDSQTYRLVGTGEPAKCIALLGELLWPTGSCAEQLAHIGSTPEEPIAPTLAQKPCFLGAVPHPRVQGPFYGMSVYYYANDAVRTLLGEAGEKLFANWPNPTVDELEAAAHKFCKQPWPGDPLDAHTNAWRNKHAFSGTKQLPHRCFESLYMSLVLEHAFGFDRDARQITFALDVEGNEVEWTLGYALAHAKIAAPLPDSQDQPHLSVEKMVTLMFAPIEKVVCFIWPLIGLLQQLISVLLPPDARAAEL